MTTLSTQPSNPTLPDPLNLPPWRAALRSLTVPLVMSLICWLGASVNYLLFHTLAELFSIVISMVVLVVASTSLQFTRNHFVVYVAVAIGWCGGLDLVHMLFFKGMHLLESDSANPPTQLWIAARFIQAVALVSAPLLLNRSVRPGWLHLGFGFAAVFSGLLIAGAYFPDAYVDGVGLTPFKITAEYLIIALMCCALALLWHRRALMSQQLLFNMAVAVVFMVAAEFAFTRYVSVYAQANLVGHVLKIFAYWFVYLALVQNTLQEPFSMLARAASTYDAVPDPTLIVLSDGHIRQANQAAARYVGQAAEQLVGRHIHALFHDAAVLPENCPVCTGMQHGRAAFSIELERDHGQRAVECSVAPFRFHGDGDAWVQVVRDITERKQAVEKIQRLSSFYEMLSASNRSVVYCKNRDSLLNDVFDALTIHNTFPRVFLALTEPDGKTMRLERSYGIRPEQLPDLARGLRNPNSFFCRKLPEFVAGSVTVHTLPTTEEEFASDPWLAWLHTEDITQRAVLPLVEDGRLIGAFALYARERTAFDADELSLLDEMASDVSFALDHLSSEERLASAKKQASLSEHRFTELFEGSPLPMQIYDLETQRLRAANKAMQQWLGYAPEDIATLDDWFERAYPDPVARQQLRTNWESQLPNAKQGTTAHSPELSLRCKDGSVRIARGTMTVIGSDAITAWTDLTDIRQSEHILRESEQRFRNMIEQTISGIYVRRGGKFIYVNPRYCEITGWSADELLGREVLTFTTTDADNLQRIQEAWAQLESGQRNVSYTVPLRRKDGQWIELGLNATHITWDDGQPATIVMAQDITERKRAEDQIESYVKQLEGTMKSTLQAVSNMVELRDPYTAGHERRVGLIAGAIGRELGWDERRCDNLEMVGLVHDIGKIAVPTEILTKPSRLSVLEMELIKCHAQAGYDILKDVHFAEPVAEIIRQHHERMDGSGYPRGLKGEEILPEARVLAVADVIESMSAHRPYRAALGVDAALEEVTNHRGQLYDPVVVDAAVRLIREKNYQLPS